MKQCDKKSLLTLCLGAAGMSLRLLQNMTGFEPGTGLPIPGSIPGILLPVLLALALLELLPVQLSVYMYMLVLHLHIENPLLQPLQSYSYNLVRM